MHIEQLQTFVHSQCAIGILCNYFYVASALCLCCVCAWTRVGCSCMCMHGASVCSASAIIYNLIYTIIGCVNIIIL